MGQIAWNAMAGSPHLGSPNKGLTPFPSSGTGLPNAWHQLFTFDADEAISFNMPKLPSNFTRTNLALEVNFVKNNGNVEVITFQVDVTANVSDGGEAVSTKDADEGSDDDATTGSLAYGLESHSIDLTANADGAEAGRELTITLWVLGASGINHTLTTDLGVRGATLVWDDA